MDWHFRVHQRMTEAEKRGQHRSWYVDELVSNIYATFPCKILTFTSRIGSNPVKWRTTRILVP